MKIGDAKDYFALVEDSAESGDKLSLSDIEDGLALVANSLPLYLGERSRYTSVILQRFVYTSEDRCSTKACFLALSIVKAFGRLIDSASDELVTEKAIHELLQFALSLIKAASDNENQSSGTSSSRSQGNDLSDGMDACNEALTCVANAMLLQPASREYAGKSQGFEALTEILGMLSDADATTAFLCGRCLLFSLISEEAAKHCVEKLGLQSVLARVISMLVDNSRDNADSSNRFTPNQATAELLKAAMSLCVYFQRGIHGSQIPAQSDMRDDSLPPENAVDFAELLSVVLKLLRVLEPSSGHLADSAKQAVSIALNFPTLHPDPIKAIWFPPNDRWINVDCIVELFKSTIGHIFSKASLASSSSASETTQTDSTRNSALLCASEAYQNELTPLTLVLVRLMTEHQDARLRVFHQVYPPNVEIDYTLLPEDRPGLASQVVRLMRVPQGGMLQGAMGDFLLTVLGQDIKQFIMAVGYGNAAGFMLARGIEMPKDALDYAKGVVSENDQMVDPVTGRNLNQTDIDKELAGMTDEEKEREAERLFVLFERLNKTGIIKTTNPVRAAAESGRFKELSDSPSKDGGEESD
ncbi:hypothetical protein IWW48_000821 [Coemansia sp. RSA 1200]|nr:hypothetical protein IWW48_000821 [Coemansia sp. RSA 1200]